jgi:hypothetical protein
VIAKDLDTVCLRCLAKDPAHRYPTARALVDELQNFFPHVPDADSNLEWGSTADNPTPRWLLIE